MYIYICMYICNPAHEHFDTVYKLETTAKNKKGQARARRSKWAH